MRVRSPPPDIGFKLSIPLPQTLGVVTDCWQTAESKLQEKIRADLPDADEEFITRLFHGSFKEQLRQASEKKLIEAAFLNDLRATLGYLPVDPAALQAIASGLLLMQHFTIEEPRGEPEGT